MKRLICAFAEWLITISYEKLTIEKLNNKMIRAVPRLMVDGKQYYEFVNLADMPDSRYAHYLDFSRELQLGMDIKKDANDYLDKIAEANDKGEKSRVGSLIYMFKDTINNCTPLESLYNMASLVYFDKEEDLRCWDADYNAAKIAAFKKIPDQSFFFSHLLGRTLKTSGLESPDDIRRYLSESRVKLSAYARLRSGNLD